MEPEKLERTVEIIPKGWTSAPKLSDLKADLEATNSSHDAHTSQVSKWLADLNPTRESRDLSDTSNPFGTKKTTAVKTRSTVKSKLIRKQAEWRYTSLSEPFLNTPDIWKADPVTHEDVEAAKQNGLILNNQVNTKLDKVAFIDEFVRTCTNEGSVIVKTGWDYQYHIEEVEYPQFEIRPAQSQEELMELQKTSQLDPSLVPVEMREALQMTQQTNQPMFPQLVGVDIVEEEVADVNQPAWEVCDYENVRIDPTCKNKLKDAQFIIHSFESSLSDLEKSGKYTNLDGLQLNTVQGDEHHKAEWARTGFEFNDKARKKFVVYEYWGYWDVDDSGSTTPIVATWVGDVMIRLEENPFPDKELPFLIVPFMPRKDSVYGEPDAELTVENQEIEGALKRGMIDVFGRSANGQTGIRKGALDAINRRRFDKGLDYEYNEAGDAQNSIFMHTFPDVGPSAYNFLQMQSMEAESLSGVQGFNQGITGAGLGSTAAAANGALSAAARRELGILRRLSEGMKQIARKFLAMNQVFLSEEETVRVTNQEFVTVRKDDLGGKFDIRLSISTAEADEQKASELAFMLQTTGQSFGIEFTKIILAEIAELRKMPHLAQQLRAYQPQPDPMAEQLRQLELQEKQVEIQKKQAEIQKILTEAGHTGVKSANVQADTDSKNLRFVEDEAGVTHARDVDKMQAQAEAQGRTKMLEAVLRNKQPTTN